LPRRRVPKRREAKLHQLAATGLALFRYGSRDTEQNHGKRHDRGRRLRAAHAGIARKYQLAAFTADIRERDCGALERARGLTT
jgi:hypothetical protein